MREGRAEGYQFFHVAFYLRVVFIFFAGVFVHVERLVDFDLNRVEAARRVRVTLDQFDALEGVVDGDVVAEAFQEITHGMGEIDVASRAVAIAEHDVAFAYRVARGALWFCRAGGHGMAVDVPDLAEIVMGFGDQLFERRVVRIKIFFDAGEDFAGA